MMKWMILVGAMSLVGCKSEGDRFADDYERAQKDPALHGSDMCEAAKSAAEAYQQEHNLEKASDWRTKATLACALAGSARLTQ